MASLTSMQEWLFRRLAGAETLPEGSRQWQWGANGIAPGYAFLLFLAVLAAVVWSYRRLDVSSRGRGALAALRAAFGVVLLALLTQPVVNLTINEPIRQNLIVLLDVSKSMSLPDKRERPDDLARAALAAGLIDPARGLKQTLPPTAAALSAVSRWDLLQKLFANARLRLLPRLSEKSDLTLYRFGRAAVSAGSLLPADGGPQLTMADAARALAGPPPAEPVTAVGGALRDVLRETRSQPTAGILLITDGGNNSGLSPVESAQLAHAQNVPLFVYGVGITSPPDLILRELTAPRLGFLNERVEVQARLHAQGIPGQSVTVALKANGRQVDTQRVELGGSDGDHDVTFRFDPSTLGDVTLEASTPVLPQEIAGDNNTAAARLRVVDNKLHVLYVEQQPRWDFRYLLTYLQRDRRLEVKCALINGETGLDKIANSPFLPGLPQDKEGIFNSNVILLGDVNPADLGDTRMKLIREWVETAGGGLVFLAGPQFDPTAYAGTPLEALLPVLPQTGLSAEQLAETAPDGVSLRLTPLGETSPYMQLAANPADNLRLWNELPPVHWTARVARAKPGAQVLLVDPRTDQSVPGGMLPVIAVQEYGAGTCVYVGTDETYRWRSHTGEKYFSAFWGKVLQSLSLQRLQDASTLIRLRTDRPQYFVGDRVVVAGKVYQEGFVPLTVGTLRAQVVPRAGGKASPIELVAVPNEPGGYRAEFIAGAPGEYQFSTFQDSRAILNFQVVEPNLEALQTALGEPLLKAVAEAAHGRYLREEDLDGLPAMLAEKSATAAVYRQVELCHSPWWLWVLLGLAATEWLLRRLMQLK